VLQDFGFKLGEIGHGNDYLLGSAPDVQHNQAVIIRGSG
jgi:hypothetical protein